MIGKFLLAVVCLLQCAFAEVDQYGLELPVSDETYALIDQIAAVSTTSGMFAFNNCNEQTVELDYCDTGCAAWKLGCITRYQGSNHVECAEMKVCNRNNAENTVMWVIIAVFLTGFFGTIIYFQFCTKDGCKDADEEKDDGFKTAA